MTNNGMPSLGLILFLTSALITALLLLPVRAILRRAGVVDRPNARSSHSIPTVRGGGVAIVAVIACFLAMLCCGPVVLLRTTGGYQITWATSQGPDLGFALLLVAFLALAVVSFIDDLKGLPARVRFAVHGAAAIAAVILLRGVQSASPISDHLSPITDNLALIATYLVAVTWIAGYTNAFNFMDGINGIAAMQAITTGLGSAAIAHAAGINGAPPVVMICAVLSGAALGFLPHNFPRARVFMGDVSSAALGFLLAVIAVWIAGMTSWWMLFWVALLHANFVLDTGITLVRRARRGDRLHEAHREHFYQRLVRAGQSHPRVTLTEGGLQVIVAVALWWATSGPAAARWLVAASVVALWSVYFAYAESVFLRHGSAIPAGGGGVAPETSSRATKSR